MKAPLLALCLALGGLTAQAATYRWVDASGRTVISDSPPPGKARAVTQTQSRPAQADDALPYAVRRAAEAFPVVLYTAANCANDCQQARELLTQRGIPFTERLVQSPEDIAELTQLVGDTFIPSLKVGKQSARGFAASNWNDLLDLAGYPKTALKKAPATP